MQGLVGYVDAIVADRTVVGWAADDTAGEPVQITATLDDTVIGTGTAEYYRADLDRTNRGLVAFTVELSHPVRSHDILSNRFKVIGSTLSGATDCIPFGQHIKKIVAAEYIKTGLQKLEAAARLLDEGALIDMLETGQTCVPPELASALAPWMRTIYRDERNLVAAHLNNDPYVLARTAAKQVLGQFESLGANCEFGLVQRHFGVETIGLLRWGAVIGLLPGTTRALHARLDGAGQSMSLRIVNGEYTSFDEKYHVQFHTDRFVGRDDPDLLLRNERARVPYLARCLIEEIEDGKKMFVFQTVHGADIRDVFDLFAAMNEIGPSPLLWVVPAERAAQIGMVEVVRPNLFRGYIDRFSPPGNIYEYCSFNIWAAICQEALRLWQNPC